MEKKEYQLICSYVERKYFVSTAFRRASTIEEMWYYETMVWEFDDKTKKNVVKCWIK